MSDIRISRSSDGNFIYFWHNGGTKTFLTKDWEELSKMILDFNTTGVKSIQNFADLPTRTPLHSNTPSPSTPKPKASLDDLI